MAEHAKCVLTKNSKPANAISRGLPELQQLLSMQGIKVDSFDDLYTTAVSIIRFVAAKERKALKEKFNTLEEKQ